MKTRLLTAVAATALALPLGVPAAHAAPPDENFQYSYEDSANFRACGLRLHEDAVGGGHFLLFGIPESDGQAWLAHDNYYFRSVLTNRDNGKWVVLSGRGLFKELTGTQIAGNIWEFTALEAGQPFVLKNSDGQVVLRDRGLLRYRATFDLLGDGEPGGELIEQEITHRAGHHAALDTDFCDMVEPLLG